MVRELNLKFKLAVQQKGGVGIRSLRRIFSQMDFNGNKKLDASEFEQALAAFGMFPKKVELQALVKFYDVDQDGNISYDEFLSGLRDELSERRVNMVRKAFQMLDKDGSGKVTVSDIAGIYDVSITPSSSRARRPRRRSWLSSSTTSMVPVATTTASSPGRSSMITTATFQ